MAMKTGTIPATKYMRDLEHQVKSLKDRVGFLEAQRDRLRTYIEAERIATDLRLNRAPDHEVAEALINKTEAWLALQPGDMTED
jgi:3-methyladenine DNA glycosylase AlkD